MKWQKTLPHDPIPTLLQCGYENIVYFTKRDLLDKRVPPIQSLWQLPPAQRIIAKQQSNGSWKYSNPKPRIRKNQGYDLLETYRQLGFLVEQFGFDKRHRAIQQAKEYIFSHQTDEGDIRGIYWNQYSPNYTAGFLELLIKAGFQNDTKVKKGLAWLLSMRQDDGGWAIPARTRQLQIGEWQKRAKPLQPDFSKPSSYMVTGVVLRAFAYHPGFQHNQKIHSAAKIVLSRLFKQDVYPDRKSVTFWTGFSFPFWYTDLIAILDPLAHLGFSPRHPKIHKGLRWFAQHQERDGTWRVHCLKGNKKEQPFWIDLSICRVLQKLYAVR